ncbi:MAG: GDP-mannose 4,6-dehydratase [Bdellovibrionales bacterium]|nr:GDP-mannose 4,6-dehydratase [Bdellovibrionales bacterium]
MSNNRSEIEKRLRGRHFRWLVSGGAGFIGSHLVQALLELDQTVTVLDNFATGSKNNIDCVSELLRPEQMKNLLVIEGDIREIDACKNALKDADYVLHQAALGSVPRSLENPLESHAVNVGGFLNMLEACRSSPSVRSFVYASSSSVYGDSEVLPKREGEIGRMLSPYAASKRADEIFAEAFVGLCAFPLIGLRYFNVFGPRQSPDGPYAAVIPIWINALLNGDRPIIYGDGDTSRDFCYVDNAVEANLLAATSDLSPETSHVFNVSVGEQTTLKALYSMIVDAVNEDSVNKGSGKSNRTVSSDPEFREFRLGDVRHSLGDLSLISSQLGFTPSVRILDGVKHTVRSFLRSRG